MKEQGKLFVFVKAGLLLYFASMILLLGLYAYNWRINAEEIIQPIDFSHKKHAGENGIECNFCHAYVDSSPRADLPPLQRCMECHNLIATEKPEIKKLIEYWNKKEPLPWIRIYSLPEFVYFSHKRHIRRGIDCSLCHGELREMTRVRSMRSLKMGWCVSCHRKFDAPTDCLVCHK